MAIVMKGVLLEALVVLATAFLFWLPSTQTSTGWVTRPMVNAYRWIRSWAIKKWKSPGGHVRVMTGAIAAVIVVGVFVIPGLDDYQPEAVSVAFTVFVLNELIRYQNRLEYKQSVIRQMASRSNEFALDAVRIAVDERWLYDGSIIKAHMVGARLQEANLRGAQLQGVDMRGVRLEESRLLGVRLDGANLTGARLQGANLRRARLQGARLVDTHLEGANLTGARLQGANLHHAHLEGANLKKVIYDSKTRWPENFTPPATAVRKG